MSRPARPQHATLRVLAKRTLGVPACLDRSLGAFPEMAKSRKHTRRYPTRLPHRSRRAELAYVAAAMATVVVFLVPEASAAYRLVAAAILVVIIIGLLLLDRAHRHRARARRTTERPEHERQSTRNQPSATIPDPPPWSVLPSIQGTFNPDDGLDSMVSPLSLLDDTGGS